MSGVGRGKASAQSGVRSSSGTKKHPQRGVLGVRNQRTGWVQRHVDRRLASSGCQSLDSVRCACIDGTDLEWEVRARAKGFEMQTGVQSQKRVSYVGSCRHGVKIQVW